MCVDEEPKLSGLGKFAHRLKIARFWRDGDTADFLWNLWNPLSWPIVLIVLIITIIVDGLRGLRDMPGITLSKYWRQHKSEREFF